MPSVDDLSFESPQFCPQHHSQEAVMWAVATTGSSSSERQSPLRRNGKGMMPSCMVMISDDGSK
jgi:hypothetical protein